MNSKLFLSTAVILLLLCANAYAQPSPDELSDTVWTVYTYPKEIRAVKFTPDGKYLVSGGSDAIPKLWNAETGELVHQFPGRPTGIWEISIANNMLAFIGPGENGIQIYDLNTFELIKSLQGSETGIFTSDGKYLVTGRNSGISVIDVNTWKEIERIGLTKYTNTLSISPDNKYVARSEDYFTLENDNRDGEISIYTLPELNHVTTLEKRDHLYCPDLAFSNSNEHLAGSLESSPNKVWNTQDWKVFKELGNDALSVTFSPDNKYVLFGEGGFKNWHLSIWDVALKQEIKTYRLDWLAKKYLDLDEGDNPFSIDVSEDLKKIAVGGSAGIYMLNAKWNPTSVQENPVIITEPQLFPNPANNIANIRFNLIRPSEVSIGIFDINSRKLADIYNGHSEPGLQNYIWNTSRIPSGTYFARISASGVTSSIKIIVNK